MIDELRSIVNVNETILYEGRPEKKCFWFENIFNPLLPFALIWAAIDLTVLGFSFAEATSTGPILFILVPFMLFHMMPVWIYLSGVIFSSMRHRNTAYIITDKNIYVSGGTFTKYIESISFSDISNINLHRGLFDQMFHVGDVIVTSYQRNEKGNRVSINISSIAGYLDIYNMVKDIHNNERNNY